MTSNVKTTKVNLRLMAATSLLALLTACGGGGGGDSGSSGSSNNSDGSLTANGVTLGFDVSDAVSLMTSAKALDSTTTLSGLITGSGPLLTEATTWTPRTTSVVAGLIPLAGAATGSSNLISVNSNGTAKLAMTSSMPTKVLYSAVDPSGTYAYFALDPDNTGQTNFDFRQTIATLNCGLYQVKLVGNVTKCVGEGKLLRAMDDSYRQAVSSGSKPIQFDKNGNVYFSALSFERNCWKNGNVEQCNMNGGWDWNGTQVYKYAVATGRLTVVSQDNEVPEYFAVLPAGDVVFNTHQTTGNWQSKLSMLRANGTNIVLADNMSWGTVFTTDTNDAVIWSNSNYSSAESGIRFARPNPAGQTGGNWAMLSTKLFANNDNNNGYTTPTPRRLIVADDGKLYGVFESYRSVCNGSGSCTSENSLRVNQVLPYDPVPKVVLRMPTNNWWDWMRTTPFVVSKGFLYYKETVDPGDGNGSRDVINMVRLSDRTVTTILNNEIFQIYNWQLAGDVLHFSGLKNSVNKVVMGQVDAKKVYQGRPSSEYLSLKYTASAASSASTINDIEVVRPVIPVDPTSLPALESFSADPENLYSVSLAFTKGMDMNDVNSKVTLKKVSDSSAVTFFPVWIYKSLHLIPVGPGLLYSTRANDVVLAYDTNYKVELPNTVVDLAGIYMPNAIDKTFKTRPLSGWYQSTAALDSTNSGLNLDADNSIYKWAQPKDQNGNWTYSNNDYEVASVMPENFRVEFSAKNNNWNGLSLYLWNAYTPQWSNQVTTRRFMQVDLGNWTNTSTTNVGSTSRNNSQYGQTNNIFTGDWLKYRLDVWGNKLRLSYCKSSCSTAGNWVGFPSQFDIDNLESRSVIGSMGLNITLSQSMEFGSFKVLTLDPNAATPTVTNAAATVSEEFISNTLPNWLTTPYQQVTPNPRAVPSWW